MLTVCATRDAWKGVEGTSNEDAMAKYVEKLLEVSPVCLSGAAPPVAGRYSQGGRRRHRRRAGDEGGGAGSTDAAA